MLVFATVARIDIMAAPREAVAFQYIRQTTPLAIVHNGISYRAVCICLCALLCGLGCFCLGLGVLIVQFIQQGAYIWIL